MHCFYSPDFRSNSLYSNHYLRYYKTNRYVVRSVCLRSGFETLIIAFCHAALLTFSVPWCDIPQPSTDAGVVKSLPKRIRYKAAPMVLCISPEIQRRVLAQRRKVQDFVRRKPLFLQENGESKRIP